MAVDVGADAPVVGGQWHRCKANNVGDEGSCEEQATDFLLRWIRAKADVQHFLAYFLVLAVDEAREVSKITCTLNMHRLSLR